MDDIGTNAALIAVWKSMAEHFLDTETRQDLPHTAFLCVNAGLSIEQAHEVWLHEVSPVVGSNLLSVAGEWAGWDEEWLVGEVRARAIRRRAARWQPLLRNLLSRYGLTVNGGSWRSIERCMRALLAARPEERAALAADLSFIAQHYFDFVPPSPAELGAERIERLRRLCPTAFDALEPATVSGEPVVACRRVRVALGMTTGEG